MALPRVALASGFDPGASASWGDYLPDLYAETTARATPAQWDAARAAQLAARDALPWFPYSPWFRLAPMPWMTANGEPEPTLPVVFPSYWLDPIGAQDWSMGARAFLQVADEQQAQAALARFGLGNLGETMSVDLGDPGKGARDRRMVLYARSGDFYRPVASRPFYKASSWVQFRDQDLPGLAAAALAIAGGPIVQAIGNALVPASLAVQFPALPGAVGSVALQTATNGGDLGAALQNAVLSATGAQAGSFAANASGFKAVGDVTQAVTTAALRGGDIKDAATMSLLQTGVRNMGDLWDNVTEWFGGTPTANVADASASYFDPVYDPPSPAGSNGMTWEDASGVVFTGDATPVSITPTMPDSGDGFDFSKALANLTNAAMAAIKVNAAYKATQAQPRAALTSGNTVQTPNANGTVTVRNTQTGAVIGTQRPAAGVPMVLADGRTIINNGDGTYTLIARDGSSQRIPYTSGGALAFPGASASSMTPLLIGAGILGAVLLMSRRRA